MNNLEKNAFYHFSVEDVFKSLIEITDKQIGLFEHPFFSFLKELHDEFNTNINLYLFFQNRINGELRTLREVSDSIKQKLIDNSWIKFGPHALEYYTPPYTQTPDEQIEVFDNIYKEISRFAGGKNISKWVRLHNFSESYELKDYFHEKGVEAIFTTDKERITTRMPNSVNESLKSTGFAQYGGLNFIRSNIRIENLVNIRITKQNLKELIDNHLKDYNHVIVLTHEYELVREEVKEMAKTFIAELYRRKIPSYPC